MGAFFEAMWRVVQQAIARETVFWGIPALHLEESLTLERARADMRVARVERIKSEALLR